MTSSVETTPDRSKVTLDGLIIGVVQMLVWGAGGYLFLLTQVDVHGRLISFWQVTVYVLVWLALLMLVPVICRGRTPPEPELNAKTALMRSLWKDFLRGCLSPCVLAIEVLVLTGNITPWVMVEPLLLLGVGNISLVERQPADGHLRLPEKPPLVSVKPQHENGVDVLALQTANWTTFVKPNGASDSKLVVLAVGGIGGGFDSPAQGLYGRLAQELRQQNIRFLDVRFRSPGNLDNSVDDLRTAISYVNNCGAEKIVLLGHSFGGGVVISTALVESKVSSVVSMSSNTIGGEYVSCLPPRPLLLIHGFFDYIVPRFTSEDLHRRAPGSRLKFVVDGHILDAAAEPVHQAVMEVIDRELRDMAQRGGG